MTKRATIAHYREAISGSGGVIQAIAERLGVTRAAVYKRIRSNPGLQAALKEESETSLDLAETKLLESIKAGDFQAVKLYLLTKGKGRGYTYRSEIEASVGVSGAVEIYLPDNGRDALAANPASNPED